MKKIQHIIKYTNYMYKINYFTEQRYLFTNIMQQNTIKRILFPFIFKRKVKM
jgi:hypothetical protein